MLRHIIIIIFTKRMILSMTVIYYCITTTLFLYFSKATSKTSLDYLNKNKIVVALAILEMENLLQS